MHSHIVSFSLRWFAFILLLYRVTRARDGHTVVVCQFVTCVRAHCSRPSCTARAQERTGKILRKSTKPSSHRIKFEQSTWNSIHCLLGQYAEKKILIFTIRTLHACCVSCVEAQRVNTQMAARKEIQNSFLVFVYQKQNQIAQPQKQKHQKQRGENNQRSKRTTTSSGPNLILFYFSFNLHRRLSPFFFLLNPKNHRLTADVLIRSVDAVHQSAIRKWSSSSKCELRQQQKSK